MSESTQWKAAGVLGWVIVAVPMAAFLAFAAWISSYKLRVSGGIAYSVALAVWAAALIWRWKRLNP